MMVIIYAALLAALTLEWLVIGRMAVMVLVCVLVFSTMWFLFHIYSPEDGFRMPWLEF